MFARGGVDADYWRSQRESRLPFRPGPVPRGLALRLVGAGDDARQRAQLATLLVSELNAAASLPPCEVVVADRAQVHEHDGRRLQSRTYGYYRCVSNPEGITGARIRIYHRTAVRHQVISPKVFLNTVLHEWVHHYDFGGLRLRRSPHTGGFFARLRVLADELGTSFVLPPDDDPSIIPFPAGRAR